MVAVRAHAVRCSILACLVLPLACQAQPAQPQVESAAWKIREDDLLRDVRVLSSDEFEGRSPGTRGEDLTVAYLSEQMRAIGLAPGNPDGTYVQEVPLVGFQSTGQGQFRVGAERMLLKPLVDLVAVSRRGVPEVQVSESPLVFVGYGVDAPEYGWDDWGDVDVRGKTVLILINDPQVPHPERPDELDPQAFRGKAMTYYGRWTYKYEVASAKGAAAALIIHETGPAGYPFEVVSGSWGRENFDLDVPGGQGERVAVEGWITREAAERVLRAAGHDLEQLKAAAIRRDFRAVPLNISVDLKVDNKLRKVRSRNVLGRLEGSDPNLRAQHVVYTAHWDHLGVDPKLEGDGIFNGAIDNATGTAALLALARAFVALEQPPRRSILFLAVTAEEKGLLGSQHYASHPLYPLETTVAAINMDALYPWGRTRDVVVVGRGNSTLEDVLEAAVRRQGRVLVEDPEPEKGSFYRSDHFEFAKRGVPALYAKPGVDYRDRPAGWGKSKRDEYTSTHYHKVSDEVREDWDLSGLVEDLRLFFEVGLRVAQRAGTPQWKEGAEFKAVRERMLEEYLAR